MRIRPLTRAELQAIRDKNYRARHKRRGSSGRNDETKNARRRKKFGDRRPVPHGPWGWCPNCKAATKQRAVYAVVTLPEGKRCWEKIFMLCRKCLWRRRTDPLIPVKTKVYSRNGTAGNGPNAILSVLNDGSLTLDRLIHRLRKKAGVAGSEFLIFEQVVKPCVDSGLISETEIDYTQSVVETIRSSKMRLRECPAEHSKTLLPLYVQSRKGELGVEKLGSYCISCKKFTLNTPRKTAFDALDVLLRSTEGVDRSEEKEKDPLDVLLDQVFHRDVPTPS
ncbi:MAG: hypothetical protein JRN52_14850 [Nitrososphaerota archaeon]|nr:hypothetical protein [Nitrososphaerota archaeon]